MALDNFPDTQKTSSRTSDQGEDFANYIQNHELAIGAAAAAIGIAVITRGHWLPFVKEVGDVGATLVDSLKGTQILTGESARAEALAISKLPPSPIYSEPALSIHKDFAAFMEHADRGNRSEALAAVERALGSNERDPYRLPSRVEYESDYVKRKLLKDFADTDTSVAGELSVSNLVTRLDDLDVHVSPYWMAEKTIDSMVPGTQGWTRLQALHNGKFFDIAKTRLDGNYPLEEQQADSIQVARRSDGSYTVDRSRVHYTDDFVFKRERTIDDYFPHRLGIKSSVPVNRLIK